MWFWSSLIFIISMKQLLGYVLYPVGVEMCRGLCCHITGKPSCVYSPIKLSCQVTQRNQLQADGDWIVLEIPTRHWALYEAKLSCAVHSRLHRSRTKGVKCISGTVLPVVAMGMMSSKSKCSEGSGCVESNPREPFQEEKTNIHPPVERKSWTKDLTKDYRKCTVGRETIYIRRIYFAMKWDNANTICERDGGQLVKVVDKETLDEVTKLFNPFDSFKKVEIWIGLRDLCNNNTFLWLDGQGLSFTKWAPEEETRYKEWGRQGKMCQNAVIICGHELVIGLLQQ